MADYIICYDISDPRRLGRIHRHLQRQAYALQYSVFLFSGTPQALEQCLARLQHLMDPEHDDIRAYPLPQRGLKLQLGQARWPTDIHWDGLKPLWRQPSPDTPSTPPTPPSASA